VKHIFAVIIVCLLAMLVFQPMQAQTNLNPNNYKLYNSWPLAVGGYSDSTSVAYYSSRVDTLGFSTHWRNGTAAFTKVAGAAFSSITIDATDTCDLDFVVRSRARIAAGADSGASAWATIVTDSFAVASVNGLTREYSLKDLDSDAFDGIDQDVMIIITHVATGNATQGNERRRVRLNWKP